MIPSPDRLRHALFFLSISCLIALFGCDFRPAESEGGNDRLVVATVIEPHAFLVRRIGGERVRVAVLVPAGKDPHNYEITPDKLALLTRSKILFRTGMPFEDQLLPKLRSLSDDLAIVDLREGIELRYMELHTHENGEQTDESGKDSKQSATTGHRHHPGCSHDGLDPHVWFAPTLLKTQAETILRSLRAIDPEGGEAFRQNDETLLEEIEATRRAIEKKLEHCRNQTVFVFHPSYGYFCDEFGLKQRAIEFEGKSPKPRQLASLIAETKRFAERSGRKPMIFVQPEFNRAPAEAVAEAIGGKLVEHSCLERDVLRSMIRFADEFAEVK